jgi:hypothetical protein
MNATIDPKFMLWSPANKGNPFWKTIKAYHPKKRKRGIKKPSFICYMQRLAKQKVR